MISVTEPTPFGEHDLQRILKLSEVVNRAPYVVVNRSTISDFPIDVPNVIASIPYDQEIMESYAKESPLCSMKLRMQTLLAKKQ